MTDNEIRLPDEVWHRIDEAVYKATKAAELVPYHSEKHADAGWQNIVLFVAPFESSPQIVLSRGDDGSE